MGGGKLGAAANVANLNGSASPGMRASVGQEIARPMQPLRSAAEAEQLAFRGRADVELLVSARRFGADRIEYQAHADTPLNGDD